MANPSRTNCLVSKVGSCSDQDSGLKHIASIKYHKNKKYYQIMLFYISSVQKKINIQLIIMSLTAFFHFILSKHNNIYMKGTCKALGHGFKSLGTFRPWPSCYDCITRSISKLCRRRPSYYDCIELFPFA